MCSWRTDLGATRSHDASDPGFGQLLDRWITNATRCGARTLDDLATMLPGVYPTVIRERLQSSLLGKTVTADVDIKTEPVDHNGCWPELPLPHPLDFTWWFDRATADELVRIAVKLSGPTDHLLFLGTPTLLIASIYSRVDRRILLIDADRLTVKSFPDNHQTYRALHCDLQGDELPKFEANVIIVDPPWYEAEFKHFLWAARQCGSIGSTILLSCPPSGTRPGIEEEVGRVFEWARALGLELVEFRSDCLVYVSPPFERNALKASGLPQMTPVWRRGNLARLVCLGPSLVSRPATTIRAAWYEEVISGIRIRIRDQEPIGWADPTLRTLIENDVLPSVSRREAIRERVDVWTSGNRIFSCAGRFVLKSILRAVKQHSDPISLVGKLLGRRLAEREKQLVSSAFARIQEVIRQEGGMLNPGADRA